jgi:hypothetical protein
MKELVITLLILSSGDKIKNKNISINESCYTWYKNNVQMNEIKTTFFSQRSYHFYEGQRVVGYICSDKELK